jgi:hypothetical protein
LLVALVVWHLIQCIIIKTMNEIEWMQVFADVDAAENYSSFF